MKQFKMPVFHLPPFILGLVWVTLLTLGSSFTPEFPLSGICLALIFVFGIYSFFAQHFFVSKYADTTIAETEAAIREERTTALEDYDSFRGDLRSEAVLYFVWTAVYFILCSLMVLFCHRRMLSPARILLTVFALYFISYLFELFYMTRSNAVRKGSELPREEYPELYAIAEKVFPKGKQVRIICAGGESLDSFLDRGHLYLTLGAYNYSILNDAELKALFVSERFQTLEHQGDIFDVVDYALRCASPAGTHPMYLPAFLFVQYPATRLSLASNISAAAAAAVLEQHALEYVKKNGCAEDYLSGYCKIRMLDFFNSIDVSRHILFYENETPDEAVVSKELESFRTVFSEKKEFWLELLKKELPDTGILPTSFSEIRQALCTESPEISLPESTEERIALCRHADRVVYEYSLPSYARDRENSYLAPRETYEAYLRGRETGKEFNVLELRPVIDACEALNLRDEMLEVCRDCIRIASVSNEAAHAHYMMGKELLNRYDPAGIDEVLFAMDVNENYIEEGGGLVLRFSRLLGLSDRIGYYSRRVREITQLAADRNLLFPDRVDMTSGLSADTSISEAQMADNLEFILSTCGTSVRTVWQIRKELTENFYSTIYVIEFSPETTPEQLSLYARKIFHYLDAQTRQYSFYSKEDFPLDPDLIPDCCIYRAD